MRASKQEKISFMVVTMSMVSCTVEELRPTISQKRMVTPSKDCNLNENDSGFVNSREFDFDLL